MLNLSALADVDFIGSVASDLELDTAFVEKDWYTVQALQAILSCSGKCGCFPVFSGGTSLSKGFGLIKRFSEDIDFKVIPPSAIYPPARAALQNEFIFGHAMPELIKAGFKQKGEMKKWAENGVTVFYGILLEYPRQFKMPDGAIPEVKVEFTFEAPKKASIDKQICSFIGMAKKNKPEIGAIPCVDPVETASDKMSAFLWRAKKDIGLPEQDRNKTLVRHFHDLAALEHLISSDDNFFNDTIILMEEGANRTGQKHFNIEGALKIVTDSVTLDQYWRIKYDSYVHHLAYGDTSQRITFDVAKQCWERLSKRILSPSPISHVTP